VAEILALGISHYPPLTGHDERMSSILKGMLRNPRLPEALRDSANWPDEMRAEWGNDEGTSSAARHREELVGWMMKTRAALDVFNPDFVLLWGDDQYENFTEDVIPPYCVNAYEKFDILVPADNVWGEPSGVAYTLPGNVPAAKFLTSRLIEEGFDTAYSYKPLHHKLGHAFSNAILYLDYNREGFPYPIVPISINCYGRHVICQRGGLPSFDRVLTPEELDPPAPTPKRLFDMGAATARILADSPWRVAILASSGWSHAFLTEKNHYLYPDTPADRGLYDALQKGQYEVWRNYSAKAIEDSGQQEVLNWMCLAGAMQELQRKPAETGFVSTWIFNSSKTFLISPPQA
jgi:Catalytic LigB subunit of aromatic ring-opening dioxygenase